MAPLMASQGQGQDTSQGQNLLKGHQVLTQVGFQLRRRAQHERAGRKSADARRVSLNTSGTLWRQLSTAGQQLPSSGPQ